ncbi:MAG TPA: peroxiredoxin-like family protein [Puia sp.]|jgi:peroxiredoxin
MSLSNELNIGSKVDSFALSNAMGKIIKLSGLLTGGPVILTWYRGNWCPYCHIHLRHLQNFLPSFWEAGASLVALTPEPPDHSLAMWEEEWLQFEVLTDVDNEISRSFGILRPIGLHFTGPEAFDPHLDNLLHTGVAELPLPAVFIIDVDSIVRYRFIDEDYRKHAEPHDILEALRTVGTKAE